MTSIDDNSIDSILAYNKDFRAKFIKALKAAGASVEHSTSLAPKVNGWRIDISNIYQFTRVQRGTQVRVEGVYDTEVKRLTYKMAPKFFMGQLSEADEAIAKGVVKVLARIEKAKDADARREAVEKARQDDVQEGKAARAEWEAKFKAKGYDVEVRVYKSGGIQDVVFKDVQGIFDALG